MTLINAKEAAKLLGIGVRTLRKWTKENKIPAIRYEHLNRYRLEDLVEWQETKTVNVPSVITPLQRKRRTKEEFRKKQEEKELMENLKKHSPKLLEAYLKNKEKTKAP